MWAWENNKALRPDGYNFMFVKACWEVMKPGIFRVLLEFHSHGSLPKGANAPFVTLIPRFLLHRIWVTPDLSSCGLPIQNLCQDFIFEAMVGLA